MTDPTLRPPQCVALWIGGSLGAVERACLRSVARVGHPVALYCYREPAGVPEGIELRDAADVLAEDRLIRHRNGSLALFADWFRVEVQRRELGTWIDADQYLLAPLDGERPYLYGYESAVYIAVGVLRLPPTSPLVTALLEVFEERTVPSWLPADEQAAADRRLRDTGRTGLADMPWGTAGPKAVTALATTLGLERWAVAPEVFYPVHWSEAEWILDPSRSLDDVVTPATVGIHLWNERIKGFKAMPAPPGSFLARLHEEGR